MTPRNRPGAWVHAIATLHGWWLPGDRRGFRSREHRIHSSGDYANPPPPEEHAGLRAWAEQHSKRIEALSVAERSRAGEAIVESLAKRGRTPLAVACAATHLHALFAAGDEDATRVFGAAKQLAALRIGRRSGRLWAQRAGLNRIRTKGHQLATFRYILAHTSEGAWAWRFDSGVVGTDPAMHRPPTRSASRGSRH